MISNRMFGNYWYMYWFLILCNGADAAAALVQEGADEHRRSSLSSR